MPHKRCSYKGMHYTLASPSRIRRLHVSGFACSQVDCKSTNIEHDAERLPLDRARAHSFTSKSGGPAHRESFSPGGEDLPVACCIQSSGCMSSPCSCLWFRDELGKVLLSCEASPDVCKARRSPNARPSSKATGSRETFSFSLSLATSIMSGECMDKQAEFPT